MAEERKELSPEEVREIAVALVRRRGAQVYRDYVDTKQRLLTLAAERKSFDYLVDKLNMTDDELGIEIRSIRDEQSNERKDERDERLLEFADAYISEQYKISKWNGREAVGAMRLFFLRINDEELLLKFDELTN